MYISLFVVHNVHGLCGHLAVHVHWLNGPLAVHNVHGLHGPLAVPNVHNYIHRYIDAPINVTPDTAFLDFFFFYYSQSQQQIIGI